MDFHSKTNEFDKYDMERVIEEMTGWVVNCNHVLQFRIFNPFTNNYVVKKKWSKTKILRMRKGTIFKGEVRRKIYNHCLNFLNSEYAQDLMYHWKSDWRANRDKELK